MPGMKQRVKDGVSLFLLRHSRFFDEKSYREQAGIPAETDAAEHYYRGGWRTADPSPAFSQAKYLEANPDVKKADVCPLAHWLLYGKRQHYALYPGYVENRYHRYRLPRAGMRILGGILYAGARKRNRRTRILAVCHIYYPEAAGETLEYLKSLRGYRWDLVATVPEGAEAVREQILQVKKNAVVREVPNRGLDVLPFIEEIKRRDPGQYDLIVKVHSKRCDPAKGRLAEGMRLRKRDWFTALFRAVLGPLWIHQNIDRLMKDEADLVAAERMIRHDSPRKERLTARFLEPFGLETEPGYTFVAGGAWMMKASCAMKLKEIPVGSVSFGEPRPGAFGLESALERYMTAGIPADRKHGNRVCSLRWVLNRILLGKDLYDGSLPKPEAEKAHPKCAAFAVTETGEKAVAGDYFTARELAEALEKRGWKTKFLSRKEPGDRWYRVGTDTDVLVSMLEDYDPQHILEDNAGLVTVGWARNWFDKWVKSPGTGLYDILLASSESACREMEEELNRKVELFPIATNAGRFAEGKTEEAVPEAYRCDICFTGNRFGKREIEDQLDPGALPGTLHIYGEGWEKVKAFVPYCRGHLPYAEIPKVYRGAKIVLDDATLSTQATGAMNSRVYDALAAGCLVLTNNRKGAEETFEGLLPVYGCREELTEQVRYWLGNEEARKAKAEELRRFVLEKHTYDIRAAKLAELIQNSELPDRRYPNQRFGRL